MVASRAWCHLRFNSFDPFFVRHHPHCCSFRRFSPFPSAQRRHRIPCVWTIEQDMFQCGHPAMIDEKRAPNIASLLGTSGKKKIRCFLPAVPVNKCSWSHVLPLTCRETTYQREQATRSLQHIGTFWNSSHCLTVKGFEIDSIALLPEFIGLESLTAMCT